MRKILLWSELKNQRVSREVILSSTDFSQYHLTISNTDSKLYFALKIQSTEHNSSIIISAEYFTSVDMHRMTSVMYYDVDGTYTVRNKGNNRSSEKFYEKSSREDLYPLLEMLLILSFIDTETLQKKKLVLSQQESNQWLVQLLYHQTAGDTLKLRPEKKLQRVSTLLYYVVINSNLQASLLFKSVPRSSSLFITTWPWFTFNLDSRTGRPCFMEMANWLVFCQLAFLTFIYSVWIIILGWYAPSLRTLSSISEEP